MARQLDESEMQEIAAFVQALYRLAGYTRRKAFAEDARYHATNLSDVMNGRAGIEGLSLLRLIQAAAKKAGLSPEETAFLATTPRPATSQSPEIGRHLRAAQQQLDEARRLIEEEAGESG